MPGKDARANNVQQSRHSFTLITSLWGNGEAGPLTLVLPLGFLRDEALQKLREKFAPDVFFLSSGRSSHFMNADVVIDFYENVLGPSFERRRTVLQERYSRCFQDEWGILLCDSFTGHHCSSAGHDAQRDLLKRLLF